MLIVSTQQFTDTYLNCVLEGGNVKFNMSYPRTQNGDLMQGSNQTPDPESSTLITTQQCNFHLQDKMCKNNYCVEQG